MSKIKYPSFSVGSSDFNAGFFAAIREIKALNKDEKNSDHLLDTIGALHTRNKGLQKGHATLTRRVRELEELVEKQQSALCASQENLSEAYAREAKRQGKRPTMCRCVETPLSERAIDAIIADVMKPEPTAADLKLQADMRAVSETAKAVGEAAKAIVERMLQPGGLLYRGLK